MFYFARVQLNGELAVQARKHCLSDRKATRSVSKQHLLSPPGHPQLNPRKDVPHPSGARTPGRSIPAISRRSDAATGPPQTDEIALSRRRRAQSHIISTSDYHLPEHRRPNGLPRRKTRKQTDNELVYHGITSVSTPRYSAPAPNTGKHCNLSGPPTVPSAPGQGGGHGGPAGIGSAPRALQDTTRGRSDRG